jgi:hypothetical protein
VDVLLALIALGLLGVVLAVRRWDEHRDPVEGRR